ncbi:putative transcription factor Homeodomain-TALE-BEL family [Dioscorea sansibarensis]
MAKHFRSSVLMGSKFFKAAQELLDEVVNVKEPKKVITKKKINREEDKDGDELTIAEKQELQLKKATLVRMFHEVKQRYRLYLHQMQVVIFSFEAVAGIGSAKTYTSLAMHTISKQFRCLCDAISDQIQETRKCLGEEDHFGPRLWVVDHQRVPQHVVMINNNAWKSQRGLPERAVDVLRSWLLENFLHPYPRVSEKDMLAKQTGLTRKQVTNWFINARVRLWKPMVEEMYLEEAKNEEQRINTNENSATVTELSDYHQLKIVTSIDSLQQNTVPDLMDVESYYSSPFVGGFAATGVSLSLGLQQFEEISQPSFSFISNNYLSLIKNNMNMQNGRSFS